MTAPWYPSYGMIWPPRMRTLLHHRWGPSYDMPWDRRGRTHPGAGGMKPPHPIRTFDGGLEASGLKLPYLVYAFDRGSKARGNGSLRFIRALGSASRVSGRRPF